MRIQQYFIWRVWGREGVGSWDLFFVLREREGVHYEERMKSATNLLSDMLTEPKPDLNVFQSNLRYSGATGKSVRPRNNKKPFNNRYKRKTRSMRSDRGGQRGSKKWPGVESQEITADLTGKSLLFFRYSFIHCL